MDPISKEALGEAIKKRMIRPTDYNRLYEVRAAEPGKDDKPDDMILEGKAITYGEKTELFEYAGTKVFEIIDRNALQGADVKDVFLKYNHSEDVMVMARTKNGTLTLDNRSDGLWIRAKLAPTQEGKDLYTLVKRGDIDKMSFAFSTDAEEEDDSVEGEITFRVTKIRKLYDVAAVPLPAYENTEIYARRAGEVETTLAKVEAAKREKDLRLARARAGIIDPKSAENKK